MLKNTNNMSEDFSSPQRIENLPTEQYYQIDMPYFNNLFGDGVLEVFICAELMQNQFYR